MPRATSPRPHRETTCLRATLDLFDGEVFELEVQSEGRRRRGAGHHGSLSAPMPSTVLRVDTARGDVVHRGDALVILEAMKMELPVRAPADGTVKAGPLQARRPRAARMPLIEIE
jgi:biotin carboxyl carrier protein